MENEKRVFVATIRIWKRFRPPWLWYNDEYCAVFSTKGKAEEYLKKHIQKLKSHTYYESVISECEVE